jgi:hypothetical protein
MATNFKVSVRRKDDCLHLKINGHFDGSSAFELIHLLQKACRGVSMIYIHTDQIQHIHPFGKNIFLKNLHLLANKTVSIVFTGKNAGQMLSEFTGKCGGISLSMA